eukprot:scaffold139126_cov19-Tisochrysis_lutea.AAC.4
MPAYQHHLQAYEGLKTADRLKENYLFIPEKVKEVYLAHILGQLASYKVGLTPHVMPRQGRGREGSLPPSLKTAA